MKTVRRVLLAVSAVLPFAMNCMLIPRNGLPVLALTLLTETGLVFFRRLLGISRRMNTVHDWVQQLLSFAGIFIGIALFPVQSSPRALGLAAAGLTALVHFLLYSVISGIVFGREKS